MNHSFSSNSSSKRSPKESFQNSNEVEKVDKDHPFFHSGSLSQSLNILILGQGGREHALAHALSCCSPRNRVFALPGSVGMLSQAQCFLNVKMNPEEVLTICRENQIQLIVIGPEVPLVDGISDLLRENGFLVFGPSREAAQLEGSKIFSKNWMKDSGIPTAPFEVVSHLEKTLQIAKEKFTPPFVLKADGLAAGKGVYICKTLEDLKQAANELFVEKKLGESGMKAVLEQFTKGWELSLLFLTDGERYEILPPLQDHKRLLTGDEGPNTGGMGTIGPIPLTAELESKIINQIIEPTLAQLRSRKILYRGVVFLGLMIQPNGDPSLLEYNVRFGDPETQSLMPLLDGNWSDVLFQVAKGSCPKLKWKSDTYVCTVVKAAPGYPENPKKGIQIEGNMNYKTEFSYFLHAGTAKNSNGNWMTYGGRVIGSVGIGSTMSEAKDRAYDQSKQVFWEGMIERKDIGAQWK